MPAPRLPVGYVAPTSDGAADVPVNFDERVAASVASALSQMRLNSSFVGCALPAVAAATQIFRSDLFGNELFQLAFGSHFRVLLITTALVAPMFTDCPWGMSEGRN